jgi:hypothetical protein
MGALRRVIWIDRWIVLRRQIIEFHCPNGPVLRASGRQRRDRVATVRRLVSWWPEVWSMPRRDQHFMIN